MYVYILINRYIKVGWHQWIKGYKLMKITVYHLVNFKIRLLKRIHAVGSIINESVFG